MGFLRLTVKTTAESVRNHDVYNYALKNLNQFYQHFYILSQTRGSLL